MLRGRARLAEIKQQAEGLERNVEAIAKRERVKQGIKQLRSKTAPPEEGKKTA